MSDMIRRDGLLEFARNHVNGMIDVNDIARFPYANAEPVRHARWMGTMCSGCLSDISSWADAAYEEIEAGELLYCPHCGCKMDVE